MVSIIFDIAHVLSAYRWQHDFSCIYLIVPIMRWGAQGYLAIAHSKAPFVQISNLYCVIFIKHR